MQQIFRRTLRQKSFFSVKLPSDLIKLTPIHVYSRRKLTSKKERAESIGDNVKNSHKDSNEKVESESKAESVVLEKRGNITFIYKLSYKNLPRQMVFSPDFYKSLTVKICLMTKFSPTILLD